MISKIIQKEKEIQNKNLAGTELSYSLDRAYTRGCIASHKQSLINLKEYMEDVRINISKLNLSLVELGIRIKLFDIMIVLTEDIEELTKMIERYK